MTHSASAVLVGHQHADKDEEHEDSLQGQHAGPQQPGLLHPAGGGVPAAPAARPARQTDGHVRVAHAGAAPVRGAAICARSYAHTNPRARDSHLTQHGNSKGCVRRGSSCVPPDTAGARQPGTRRGWWGGLCGRHATSTGRRAGLGGSNSWADVADLPESRGLISGL